ncbi:MAG: hypothetical protein R3A13_09140 [Bdellovibrionota bacterium]
MKRKNLTLTKCSFSDKPDKDDIVYWQKLGSRAIFEAAEELTEIYCKLKWGNDAPLPRLDRSIEDFQRQ